jgi:hypothetical protein
MQQTFGPLSPYGWHNNDHYPPTPYNNHCYSWSGLSPQYPIQPLSMTLQYPDGTVQWTPHTFSGASASMPLPPVDMPNPWTSAVVPDTRTSRVDVHPNLQRGLTKWNISRSPSTASHQGSRSAFAIQFSCFALQPEFRKITIDAGIDTGLTQWIRIWGRLRVHAQDHAGITIKNVMDAIYNYFHTPLGAADLANMSQFSLQQLYRAQVVRMNSALDRNRTPDQGPLRVDLLSGRTHFECLYVVSFQGSHCKMALRLTPNPNL